MMCPPLYLIPEEVVLDGVRILYIHVPKHADVCRCGGKKANGFGVLNPKTFTPMSKNPAITKVFREIGLADELGSGMRNSYKYSALYSGQAPVFTEGDVFRITVPLPEAALVRFGGVVESSGLDRGVDTAQKETGKETGKETRNAIIRLICDNPEITTQSIAEKLNMKPKTVQYHIQRLKSDGVIKRLGGRFGGQWVVETTI